MRLLLGWSLLLASFSVAVLWFAEHPGQLELDWLGYRISVPIGLFFAGMVVLLLVTLPLLILLRRVLRLPFYWRERQRVSSYRKGLGAVTDALVALSIADAPEAVRQLKKAENQLGEQPITRLLHAQIAHRQGNAARTLEYLEQLKETPSTRFIAARAATRLAREAGDAETAIRNAREAVRLRPKDSATVRVLFSLLLETERWQEAEHLIRSARRMRRIGSEESSHALALMGLMQSRSIGRKDEPAYALRLVAQAHKLDPALLPATLLAARLQADAGNTRLAAATLERGWRAMPHPDILEKLLDIHVSEAPQRRMKRVRVLTRQNPSHPESQLALAVAAMRGEDWETARNHLKSALSLREQPRTYKMLATLEQRQFHNEQAASGWLARAAEAPPDPVWLCGECGQRHEQWVIRCGHCDAFDAIRWDTPRAHHERPRPPLLLTA